MDPSIDQTDPTPPETSSSSPKHKKLIITLVIVSVLIITALVTAILFTQAAVKEVAKVPPDPTLRIEREGYPAMDESVGDPFALVQSANSKPVSYQKQPVVDACSLLSLEAIKKQRLLVTPGTDAGKISRHFFDGGSDTVDKSWLDSAELARDLNECDYPLINSGKNNGNLHIEVYQPAYASAAGLRDVLDDYLRSGETIEGVALFNRTNTPIEDDRTFYFLEYKGVYVSLEFAIQSDTEGTIARSLLESVAANVRSMTQNPAGPSLFAYKSSTFTGRYVSACSISSAQDIKDVFKRPASPLIHERLAPSIGVLSYGNKKQNYIKNHCIRTMTSSDEANVLTYETASYESDEGASAAFVPLKTGGAIAIEKLGNEAFFVTDSSPRNALYIRSGTAIVTIAIQDEQTSSPETYIKTLTPVAQKVIERIANYEERSEAKATEKPSTE